LDQFPAVSAVPPSFRADSGKRWQRLSMLLPAFDQELLMVQRAGLSTAV